MKNLKKLRIERGISQQILADELGISQQSIYKYENKKAEPDIATIIKLANYFCCTVDYLIGNSDTNTIKSSMELSPSDLYLLELFRNTSKASQTSILALLQELQKH